ncbi:MAG: hypothetical protein P1U56_21210 [Saprospiraceae bacterium]|nr:hypothetical protein [Saprospiraceae bacterium]
MKNLLIAIIFACFGSLVSAQVEVKEGSKSMVEGTYNAYTVVLENVEPDAAEDAWKEFMKEFKAKVKKDKKSKIYFSDNVQMPSISSNPVDMYASITGEKGGSSTVSVWFDTGSGYVNSIDMEAQSETAHGLITEYGTKVMIKHTAEIQKKEEDLLKDLNKDAEKLNDKNKDLREDIAKAKANILKWEKELEQNEDNIKKKKKAIESQEIMVKKAKTTSNKYQ